MLPLVKENSTSFAMKKNRIESGKDMPYEKLGNPRNVRNLKKTVVDCACGLGYF